MSSNNNLEEKGAISWFQKSRSESSASSKAKGSTTQTPSRRSKSLTANSIKWPRINAMWNILFRAFGLSLITHAFGSFRHPVGRGLHEPTKIAMNQNRFVASLRALIHVVPVSVALCEVILNWNTYYVGTTAYNQATYQLIAKLHEIMMQASIAAVVFCCIRSEMALGSGIPFGLLFSGLQITQISYLWSMEFWASLTSGIRRTYRRYLLLLLIPLSIILASVCGPSSAVLLVPTLQYWPGGSTDIWINATTSDLWPNQTDSRSIPESCSVVTPEEMTDVCPSAQWSKIRDFMYVEKQMLPSAYKDRFYVSQAPSGMDLPGRSSVGYLSVTEDESYLGLGPRPVTAMTQHAVVADALTNTGALWFLALTNVTARKGHGHPLSDQSDALHTISNNYMQPYSTVVCIPDSISSPNSSEPLALPRLPNANSASLSNGNFSYDGCEPGTKVIAGTIAHPTITQEQIHNLPHSTRDFRLEWIELDSDHFQGSSIGAVVLLPRDEKNTTQDVILCNLSAGWGTSTLSMSTVDGSDTPVSSQVTHKDNHTTPTQPMKLTNLPEYEATESAQRGNYFDFHLPNYPRQLINITKDWAEYLNPTIADLNTTVMSTLLQQQLFSCTPRVSVEQALVSIVVNGLAKTGAGSRLQGSVRTVGPNGDQGLDGNYWLSGKGNVFQVDHPKEDWLKFHVKSTLKGYGYNAFEVPKRLAIAFLTIYCILALGHMIYEVVSGISSNCWDSIAEVTALAMNSSPTAALRNTCAGITEMHIFKLSVQILSMNDIEGEGEHLELVFGEVDPETTDKGTIKTNRAYGTMPAS